MVQHILGKALGFRVRQIRAQPLGVQARFVHADEADGGEMIVERAQVTLRIGIQPFVQQLGDDGALDLERARGDVHHMVKARIKIFFVGGQVGDARQVDRYNAHGAGAFAAAEEAAGLFAQLAQVEPEAAAHAAHVGRLHFAVDVVGEVRRAVLGGHFKQQTVVLGLGPVKIAGDGIGRNRVLEAAAVGVALDHDLDERLVDHVHFFLAVAVGEGHFLAADDRVHVFKVVWHGPVQRDIGERRLRAPAAGRVHAVNEGFDALFHVIIGQMIDLYKRRKVGIKG